MGEIVYWEGKCQKVHLLREDIGNIIMCIAISAFILYYRSVIGIKSFLDLCIVIILGIAACYLTVGQILFRFYYTRNVWYQITDENIVIVMKILRWEYKRCYALKDIGIVSRRIYRNGIGSIHFGDVENKMWETGQGYASKVKPILSGGGMLRRDNKYHSGILYSINNVEAVYKLLMDLIED